jgi:sulfate transport system permease protein
MRRAAAAGPAHALPGFGLTLGFTLAYLSLVVLLPLAALVLKGAALGPRGLLAAVSTPRVLAACRLSLAASLAAAAANGVFGLVVSWVLVRYRFPGRRLMDALVDLPFALPTAVAGIALTSLYAPTGWLGRPLSALGLPVAYTRLGIALALTFVGLPFVVRTLEPVLLGLDPELEEAGASLGASRWQVFRRIVLPTLLPAWLTGFALALGRALGEYGSVVFIAGNMPNKTEIAPLLVMTKLEQYDYAGATAIAVVLLLASFALLLSINTLQVWAARRGATA